MRQGTLVLDVGIGTALLGGAIGWTLAPSWDRGMPSSAFPVAGREPLRDTVSAGTAVRPAPSSAASAAPDRAPADRGRQPMDLIGEELRAYARAEISRGWASQTDASLPDELLQEGLEGFEKAVLLAPEEIGKHLARREAEYAAARERGEAFVLFVDLDQGRGPLPDLVADEERFGALFAAQTAGPTLDGTASTDELLDGLVDGTTLVFGPGAHRVDFQRLLDRQGPFPRDVTVAGAGRSTTLLLSLSDLSVRSPLRNLTFRDCTIFTNGDAMFDLRRDGAVLRFERVHLIGFDGGQGGSSLFALQGCALLLTDCIIEGGYGGFPGHCQLFDVRTDAHLARFERCDLIRILIGPARLRPGATVLFTGCRLVDLLDRPEAFASPRPGLSFDRSSISFFDRSVGDPPAKRLEDRFPGWNLPRDR
ncbi:MAG: hypothetical protein AB1726_04110 [Planctomycetota bacterium]